MKKILIVDDNQYLTTYLDKKLSDSGHRVIIESTGLTALTRLADYTPDFIFIDYVLPQINGDKLCQLIRRMDHLNLSYLVLMSAAAKELQLDPTRISADLIIAKGTYKETAGYLLSVMAAAPNLPPPKPPDGIMGLDSILSRRMTIELLEKNRHHQTVLDSISDGILESHHGQIVYANPAAALILNKPLDQLLIVRPADLFPELARPLIESLMITNDSNQSFIQLEKPIKVGEKIISLKKLPLPGDSDSLIFLLTDITEHMDREDRLHNYQAHLEKVVENRTTDLQQAKDKLQIERERLRSLTAQLLSAQENERRRISLELHDELGQILTAVQLNLQQVESEIPVEDIPTKEKLEETRSIVEQAAQQIRELSVFLRPAILDDLGLLPTLRWHLNGFRQRTNLEIQFEVKGMEERLDQERETFLYRIIQEALNNIAKYAQARKVIIGLQRRDKVIAGYIQDDGTGFDLKENRPPKSMTPGIGLIGMRERASLLGGHLTIESAKGQGTRIAFEIPLASPEEPWTR